VRRYWVYLKYVLKHKYFVFQAGRELHVPLLRLILHDWDKFLPDEFFPYAEFFYAPDGTGQRNQTDLQRKRFSVAWQKHQQRNSHHWQWHLTLADDGMFVRKSRYLINDDGTVFYVYPKSLVGPMVTPPMQIPIFVSHPIPDVDLREMLADWKGAGRAVGKPDTAVWYFDKARQDVFKRFLHPSTRQWLDERIDPEWSNFAQIVEKHRYE
jgi:hypothetical protein